MEHSKCAETIKSDEKTKKKTTNDSCSYKAVLKKCYRDKARRTQSCGVPSFYMIFLQMFSKDYKSLLNEYEERGISSLLLTWF